MKKFSLSLLGKKKNRYDEEGLDGYDWYEGQPRWPLTRILKVVFTTISILVWAVILIRIFSSQNSQFEKMILLNDTAAGFYPGEDAAVTRIHSATDGQEDEAVFVYYPVYLDEAQNLQLTARIRRSKLPPTGGDLGYTFILRERVGDTTRYYPLSYHALERRFGYAFFRLCWEEVVWDPQGVYTFLIFDGDYDPEKADEPYAALDAHFSFTVSNKDTYSSKITPPKKVWEWVE